MAQVARCSVETRTTDLPPWPRGGPALAPLYRRPARPGAERCRRAQVGIGRAHWLAGCCVVLHGPDPDAIVTAPTWGEQRAGLEAELVFLRGVAPEDDAYAVLNACRILRSLAEKDVVQSKFGSAAWALEHLPAEFDRVIRAGLSTYRGAATAADAEALATARPAIEALASASFASAWP